MKKFTHLSFIALILALSMLLCPQTAMAEELPKNVSNVSSAMIPLEETDITREEAIKILGISNEEAEKMTFYVTNAEPAESTNYKNGGSTRGVSIGPNEAYAFPTFTFSGNNTGAYWTCMGTRLTWGAVHHSAADINTYISIFLYGYGMEDPNNVFAGATDFVLSLGVGQTYHMGSFVDATPNYDYHFVYYGGDQSMVTVVVGIV